jgi:hypothetical protein
VNRGVLGFVALVLSIGVVVFRSGGSKDLARREVPTTKLMESELVATISEGEEVDIDSHLKPGLWTIVEFYADW